jgi:hypothetical protein
MVTKEKISKEIHELMEQPLCHKNVELLADLIYIHRHMDECRKDDSWGWGNRWVDAMVNADGTHGAHWTMEQVAEVAKMKGFTGNTWLLWIAMNAEYSDRSEVNRKHGMVTVDFYYDSAVAFWLEDDDAVENKLLKYYEHVVKC